MFSTVIINVKGSFTFTDKLPALCPLTVCESMGSALFTYIVLLGMFIVPGYSVHVAFAVLVMFVPAIAWLLVR